MPKYISIPQGKIARFEQDVTQNIMGFFTDGITSCCLMVLTGKINGRRRISVLHSDNYLLNMSPEILLAEIAWVGDIVACDLYRHPLQGGEPSHPLANFIKKSSASLVEYDLDPNLGNYAEFSITFDESKTNGYQFESFSCLTCRKEIEIVSHPQIEKIYAFYNLNTILSETDSNAKFTVLCRDDSDLLLRWNNYQMTFAERRQLTKDDASLLDHNPIIFDSIAFTKPGKHDLSLTPFSTNFFRGVEKISDAEYNSLKQTVRATGIRLLFEMNQDQAAIIKRIQHYDPALRIIRQTVDNVMDNSSTIAYLYAFITNEFNISYIRDTKIRSLVGRHLEGSTVIKQKLLSEKDALAKRAISHFQKKEFSATLTLFKQLLGNCQLLYADNHLEMGTIHFNLRSTYFNLSKEEVSVPLCAENLNMAHIHLSQSCQIREQHKDPSLEKSQHRLTEISTIMINKNLPFPQTALISSVNGESKTSTYKHNT